MSKSLGSRGHNEKNNKRNIQGQFVSKSLGRGHNEKNNKRNIQGQFVSKSLGRGHNEKNNKRNIQGHVWSKGLGRGHKGKNKREIYRVKFRVKAWAEDIRLALTTEIGARVNVMS